MVLFRGILEGRAGIKKNGKRAFGNRIVTSERYESWHRGAALSLFCIKRKLPNQADFPIKSPVNLKCLFYFENHKNEPDLSNLYQGVEDILQEIGVLANDRLVYSHDGSRKLFGERARIEIEITHFEEKT